jgi:hypothetical protein
MANCGSASLVAATHSASCESASHHLSQGHSQNLFGGRRRKATNYGGKLQMVGVSEADPEVEVPIGFPDPDMHS